MGLQLQLATVLFVIVAVYTEVNSFSLATHECRSPSDCGNGECCVLGMQRYSIPQCAARGKKGDWCHVGAVPEDRVLHYPNQDIKSVEDVYILFCPCADGYSCYENKCSMMRYSTAQCMPLGQVDNYCREENIPENRTLYYPNGISVDVVNIYTHVCPCGDGLACEDNFCAVLEDNSYENNYLY